MLHIAPPLLAFGVLLLYIALTTEVDMEREKQMVKIKQKAQWFWQNLEKNVKNQEKSKGCDILSYDQSCDMSSKFATELDLKGFSREFVDTELINQYTQEHKGIPEVFNMFDKDQSGTISEDEFMEFAYKHGLSRPDVFGMETQIILIGNPGTGKSTLLNALIRSHAASGTGEANHFDSGIAVGKGITDDMKRVKKTRKFLKENTVDVSFIDTPGLADVARAEAASQEIRKALTFEGNYKVFFVLTLRNGRIIGEDKATMQLVLKAAPIKHYGVIFNQVTEGEMEMLKDDSAKTTVMAYFNAGLSPQTPNIYFQPQLTQLAGKKNAQFEMPTDMLTFIRDTPSTMIPRHDVKDLMAKDWEGVAQTLRALQEEMERDKEKRQALIEELTGKFSKEKEEMNKLLQEANKKTEELEEFFNLPYYQQAYRKAMGTAPMMR